MEEIRPAFSAVHNLSSIDFRDNYHKVLVVANFFSPRPSLTYVIFRSNIVGSTVHRSSLNRSYTIKFALSLPQSPYICKATVMDPVVSSPAESSTLPLSEVQGNPPNLVELLHDIINATTVEEIQFAIKHLNKFTLSSAKLVRILFEIPKSSQ